MIGARGCPRGVVEDIRHQVCHAFRPWVISHHVVHEHSQDRSAAALGRLAVHAGPNRLQQPHRLVRSSGFHGHPVERHGFGQRRRAERVLRGHVGAGHPIPHDLPRPVRPRAGSSSVQLTMRAVFPGPGVSARPVQPLRRRGLCVRVGLDDDEPGHRLVHRPVVHQHRLHPSGGFEHAGVRA